MKKQVLSCLLAVGILFVWVTVPVAAALPLSYAENFNDGVADNFTVVSGTWSITSDDTNVYKTNPTDSLSRSVLGESYWRNYNIETRVKVNEWGSTSWRTAALLARYSDADNYYLLGYDNGSLKIKKKVAGVQTDLATKPYTFNTGTWYTLKAEVNATTLKLFVNGTQELSTTDTALAVGKTGLISVFGDTFFDDFCITPVKPTADNTGPTGTLTPASGVIHATTAGTVYENLDLAGMIYVKANNITIRNCRINGAGQYFCIRNNGGYTGLTIENVEMLNPMAECIAGTQYTVRWSEMYDSRGDAMKVGTDCVVESNYVHHLGMADGAHADAIQCLGGDNIAIRYNNLDMPCYPPAPYKSNANFISNTTGVTNVMIDGNWLNGGGFTLYLHSGISVVNNRFGRDYVWGVKTGTPALWSNNVWDDTGVLIP